jgi:hypothetical protein
MELKKVVYKDRSASKWAAEIIDLDELGDAGFQVWRALYDSEKEAHDAARNQITRKMKSLS